MIPYVVNHLCDLYGTHLCRLQCITSWPFWLWIMAVTWLHLPLTFSRLCLKNLGMGAWARTLKLCKVFTKVSWGPWLKRKLCLGPTSVINCTPLSTLSFWVSLLPRTFGYNIWCIGRGTPHFEETSPAWGYSETFQSREGISLYWKGSIPRCPELSRWWILDGSR